MCILKMEEVQWENGLPSGEDPLLLELEGAAETKQMEFGILLETKMMLSE